MMIMAKKEYIEREAVRNELYDADAITMSGVAILNNVPTADVVEVRHGEWVDVGHGMYACSNCYYERLMIATTEEGRRYCPACGAKMDVEATSEDCRVVTPLTSKYSLKKRPPLTKTQLEQMRAEMDGKGDFG